MSAERKREGGSSTAAHTPGPTLGDVLAEALARQPTLIEKLNTICNEIFERWDNDQRSGKLLSALAGHLPPKYRAEVADIRRALVAHDDMLAALQTIGAFPITNERENMDAHNMALIAIAAIAAAVGEQK